MHAFARAFAQGGVHSAEYRRLDAEYRDYFQRYVRSAGYYDLFLISTQGNVVYSQAHEADFATNLFTGPYSNSGLAMVSRNALDLLQSGISEFELYAPSRNAMAAFIAVPVMYQGRAIGVLALQVDSAHVFEVMLDKTGLGVSGETVVARRDSDAAALAVAPLDTIPDAALKHRIPLAGPKHVVPLMRALNGERGTGFETDYDGHAVVAAWRYVPVLRAGMVVKMNTEEALAPLYRMRTFSLTVVGVAILLAVVAALLLARRVTGPLQALSDAAQNFAQGKLAQRAAITGRDELGQLATSFNSMAERLQEFYTDLEGQVEQRTAELRQNVENIRIKDAAIESSINAIAMAGMDGKIFYVNRAFTELWQMPQKEDAIGKSPVNFWEKPEDAQQVMQAMQQQGHWVGELHARLHDGTHAVLQVSASMVLDGSAQPVCMLASFVDISARKHAEQQLQKSEALLESLVSNMPTMVFVKRASDLRFEKLNRAGEVLLGYTEQELLGKNDYDFFPSEQAEHFIASDREVLKSCQLKDIPQEAVLTRDGETRILHTRKIGIYNAAGEPTHLLGVSIDITEQIRAEEALQRERDFASGLVNTAPVIVLLLDTQGCIQFVNAYFEQLSGYRLDEIRGKDWFATFLPERDRQRIGELFREAVHEQPALGNINPIVTRSGTEIEIEWNNQAMRNAQGAIIAVLAIGQDVTARRALEHELRNSAERQMGRLKKAHFETAMRLKAKRIVMGECGHAFRSVYDVGNRWLGWKMPPIPVTHAVEFYHELFEQGKIKVAKKFRDPVTFHDPCNIVRGLGLHEKAREVVRATCSSLIEMEPNREHNYCCCAGGGVINCGPPYKVKRIEGDRIKAEQLKAAYEKGARVVIAPCHNCHGGLEDIHHHYGIDMEIKFLSDIIYETMEKPGPK